MAMRFHIAICAATPVELLTLLAVHFAVGLTTNRIIPYFENSQFFAQHQGPGRGVSATVLDGRLNHKMKSRLSPTESGFSVTIINRYTIKLMPGIPIPI
jgi:hypothetical protein